MDINIEMIKEAVDYLMGADLREENGWSNEKIEVLEKLRDMDFNVDFEKRYKYTYEIKNCWYNKDESDYIYGFSYVVSDKKYTYEEFESMCEKAREVLGKDTYDIKEYLINSYGFKEMPIESSFEYVQFEEEEEESSL